MLYLRCFVFSLLKDAGPLLINKVVENKKNKDVCQKTDYCGKLIDIKEEELGNENSDQY